MDPSMRCTNCIGDAWIECEAARAAGANSLAGLEASGIDADLRSAAQEQILERISSRIGRLGCRFEQGGVKSQLLEASGSSQQ